MPKNHPNNPVPKYRLHRHTGQGAVVLNGEWKYLGKYDSPESREAYDQLLAQWLIRGRHLPEERGASQELRVKDLILRYVTFCEQRFAHRRTRKSLMSRIIVGLRPVRRLFGNSPAADFGPKSLLLVRDAYIETGLARKTVNDNVQVVKRMFKWGVREELIPPSLHHGLSAVEGLRAGDSTAPEPRKVLPVPDEFVDAVLPHVLPPVRAMIELQRLTGMRPGEVTIMRTADLDTSAELWVYRPRIHKTDLHGHAREIYLGAQAQRVLGPFLRRNLEEFIFRPDEAEAERDRQCRAARKTPRWAAHGRAHARRRRLKPKRIPRDHYDVTTYARAISRGCEKADRIEKLRRGLMQPPVCSKCGRSFTTEGLLRRHQARKHAGDPLGAELSSRPVLEPVAVPEPVIPIWTPHQLRHSYATRIRKAYGIEAARVLLGHKHVGVTEIYAERDQSVAQTVAAKIG